jgi:hypothetical protein
MLVWIISNYEFLGHGQENMLIENGGKINNFTIISHTRTIEEKDKPVKDSFYDRFNHLYQRIPVHDMKITVGDFNTKIGKDIYRSVTGKWSLHET